VIGHRRKLIILRIEPSSPISANRILLVVDKQLARERCSRQGDKQRASRRLAAQGVIHLDKSRGAA
jgi:hypothetical protein